MKTLVFYTVKPVLSDHIKQDMFLAFQKGCCLLLHEISCLLLHESSAESSVCATLIHQ